MSRQSRGLGRRQAVGERQRHRGIVGPGPRCQLEGTAAYHVDQPRLRIAGGKLERGANRVTHRQTKEGPERPVLAALPLARDTCVHAQSTLESSPQLQDIRITRSISEGVHGGREGGCEPVREQQR